MTEEILTLLTKVRPKGIEVAAYPYIVEMLINLVTLDLTRAEGENGEVLLKGETH